MFACAAVYIMSLLRITDKHHTKGINGTHLPRNLGVWDYNCHLTAALDRGTYHRLTLYKTSSVSNLIVC